MSQIVVGAKLFSCDDSHTVTIIGVGSEGRSSLEALSSKGKFVCNISCMTDLENKFIEGSDKFILDSTHCSLSRISAMAGLEVSENKVYADMCQIDSGKFKGRESDQELITYAPVGMGAIDVAVAHLAYQKAVKASVGTQVTLYQS